MHYLSHTLTMVTLYGDKTFAQLTISKIIKIADKVKIENCLFINKYTTNKLPSVLLNIVI